MICQEMFQTLEQDGFVIVPGVLSPTQISQWLESLRQFFEHDPASIKNRQGAVYAARNIVESLPSCCQVAEHPPLPELLAGSLGADYGLVRGLYFDKHPDRTWSLPWHKDLTIAVADNALPSQRFTKPTNKSGVPHVEAPETILANMLTLRFHLDNVTLDNGPLEVAVGSHQQGKRADEQHRVRKILVNAGDVLAMRPMLSHASGSSTPGTSLHRRILHLEFAGDRVLGDGFEWFHFKR